MFFVTCGGDSATQFVTGYYLNGKYYGTAGYDPNQNQSIEDLTFIQYEGSNSAGYCDLYGVATPEGYRVTFRREMGGGMFGQYESEKEQSTLTFTTPEEVLGWLIRFANQPEILEWHSYQSFDAQSLVECHELANRRNPAC